MIMGNRKLEAKRGRNVAKSSRSWQRHKPRCGVQEEKEGKGENIFRSLLCSIQPLHPVRFLQCSPGYSPACLPGRPHPGLPLKLPDLPMTHIQCPSLVSAQLCYNKPLGFFQTYLPLPMASFWAEFNLSTQRILSHPSLGLSEYL